MSWKILPIAAFMMLAVFGCSVEQTEEGELPDVDVQVEEGNMPEYDVETPDVDVRTEEREIEVPDVDVDTERRTVPVPDVDVEMPQDRDDPNS